VLLFGPETRGLPLTVRNHRVVTEVLRIPMSPNNRSLNLSNSVAIVLYEAWRQIGFQGGIV
ncbi:MAG: tRNA (cytidine(34)-2'-O)-methyltransferase, partial [Litorivicinaceae bacterium]